jgi:hypothetical protein
MERRASSHQTAGVCRAGKNARTSVTSSCCPGHAIGSASGSNYLRHLPGSQIERRDFSRFHA